MSLKLLENVCTLLSTRIPRSTNLYHNRLHSALYLSQNYAQPRPCNCHLVHKICIARQLSSVGTVQENEAIIVDANELVKNDLENFHAKINEHLYTPVEDMRQMCSYYFDGQGKGFRPMVVFLMARACNLQNSTSNKISEEQEKVALIAEMIHVGSLIHDDVVDFSDTRRGKDSVNFVCGDRKAVMTGNYVVSNASKLLSTIDDTAVTKIITQIIDDIVRGEFMQQDNKNTFDQYLKKTYKKTASLIANCCKAVAHLSNNSPQVTEAAYNYGKNIGTAFQIIDDMLDFVSNTGMLGKPSAADLKLGLATAPVLFASETYPELNEMMLRRFQKPGDVEKAFKLTNSSDAIYETKLLAEKYCNDALKNLAILPPSHERLALEQLTKFVLDRNK